MIALLFQVHEYLLHAYFEMPKIYIFNAPTSYIGLHEQQPPLQPRHFQGPVP